MGKPPFKQLLKRLHVAHAKLWWACIVIYWAGKLAPYWSEPLGDLYSTALAGLLNIAFFPPVAVMILGIGVTLHANGSHGVIGNLSSRPARKCFPSGRSVDCATLTRTHSILDLECSIGSTSIQTIRRIIYRGVP